MKDKNEKAFKWSKGKIAGQVGHACMRLGINITEEEMFDHMASEMGETPLNITTRTDYINDGEVKIIYKVDDFPTVLDGIYKYADFCDSDGEYNFEDYYELDDAYVQFVQDNTTEEYIVMAVLTNKELKETFKLL